MIDFNNIIKNLSASPTAKGFLGGLAGGAVTGAMTSKKGRKGATKLLKYGGMAAVGALAWKAYKQYAESQNQTRLPNQPEVQAAAFTEQNARINQWNALESRSFQNLGDSPVYQDQRLFVLKTMVAAAMADGHIDGKEYQNILSKADDMALSAEDKTVLFNEISNPMTLQSVIQQTNSPALAMEVYTASLLAIDEEKVEGQHYLAQLAHGLNLPAPLIEAVHSQVQNA